MIKISIDLACAMREHEGYFGRDSFWYPYATMHAPSRIIGALRSWPILKGPRM